MLSASGPIRKAGAGGGPVRFRPDTKSGWGGVGGVGVCVLYTSGTIRKAGGLLSRRGGGTLHERDLLNSARFTIIINDFRNFNNSSAKIFSYIYRA